MDENAILFMVKQDIGEPFASADRERWISQQISAAKARIKAHGVTFTAEPLYTEREANLIAMYAAWLIRKRAGGDAMPPMVRSALHDLLFSQKAAAEV